MPRKRSATAPRKSSKGYKSTADKLPITAEKRTPPKGVPFHPGYDPRRNYKGRPKTHDELREMILNIGAQEIEVTTANGETYKAPLAYFMLRDMFTGRDSRDHQNILEHGWGKVTQGVNVRTWRDDVIDLLRAGTVTPEQVETEIGSELAREIFATAGIRGDEARQVDSKVGASKPD